jgi:hypothetical protein
MKKELTKFKDLAKKTIKALNTQEILSLLSQNDN